MYINLVLGAVALVVVWVYLKKLFTKDGGELKNSPAELLENELQRRREKEHETARAFERLADAAKQRVLLIAEALGEMRAAMPEDAANRLSWSMEEDTLIITMRGKGGPDGTGETGTSLEVSWKVPDLDLRAAARNADSLPGEYVLRFASGSREERAATPDACMRHLTSFIVDLME